LSAEVGAFLSSFETMTIWHLRDLVSGIRTMIKCTDVKVIQLPNFKGLFYDDLIEFARSYPDEVVMRCLPEPEKEIRKLPRGYLGSLIYTRVGDDFKQWVN